MRRFAGLAVLICAAVIAVPAIAAAGPALPTADSFYSYTGATPLAQIARGTILHSRTISVSLSDSATPPSLPTTFSATQVLYRSTDELGRAAVAVATVVHPTVPLQAGKIVSWQMAYDGLGGECDPSYALQGGTPTNDTNSIEEAPILALALEGYTVVVPDYEGTDNQWLAGQEEGDMTLDGIRATENLLKLPAASTPVGMVGYSGGSVPTNFAAELAPSYAPELKIVGAAFGGVPVDLAHTISYINKSASWSYVMPGALEGLSRAFGVSLTKYLSPLGAKLVSEDQGACINTFADPAPIAYTQLVKPQYAQIFAIPALARMLNRVIMGNDGTPQEPLFIGVGNADGTGDGVMIANDVEALAHEYCQQGVSTQFQVYKGLTHAEAIPSFFAGAIGFLTERFDGVTAQNGCASIAAGNSLAPLPLPAPAKPEHRKGRAHRRRPH